MQYYFEQMPAQRWILFFLLAISYPATYLIAFFLDDYIWLMLVAFSPIAGQLFVSNRVGITLAVVSTLFFIFTAVRIEFNEWRLVLVFYAAVTWLMLFTGYFHVKKKYVETNAYEDKTATLQEEVTLLRGKYKNDLMASVANKKKIEKYSLLNRVSNAFGAQLQLNKLIELVLKEIQDIIGPERGRFIIALSSGEDRLDMVASLPEQNRPDDMLLDQYTEWIYEHKAGLLITDTKNDFRFQAYKEQLVRSLMLAPMVISGEVIGFIRVESPWANLFNADDLRLLTIMTGIVAVAAENARLYQKQEELAITDGLTGLYLRRFFDQRFEEELGRFQVHGTEFSLMMLDIDYFKHINDRQGHLAGDQVLVQFSRALQSEIRSIDILSRYGGEEFALLLPNTQVEGALVMAERIRKRVEETPFQAIDKTIKVTISVGVGECPRHAQSINKLIKAADDALYGAKRNGRNQVMLAAVEEENIDLPEEPDELGSA